jgi:DNA-binding MarR family transcriptional regulator
MFDKPHNVTPRVLIEFTEDLYMTLAEKYGGGCTLNDLRVINQIIGCHFDGLESTVTALHSMTGIPTPTISRSVRKFRTEGWLSVRQDPDDGRKQIISLSHRSLTITRDDIDRRIRWINNFRTTGIST